MTASAAVAAASSAAVAAAAAALLLLTACGGPRRPSLAAQVDAADALVAEGCYRCLDEAVARYFALPPATGRTAAVNETKLFRALVFLALREKELGLDAAQRLRQAGLLVPRVLAPAIAREQLRWAELLPANPSASGPDGNEAARRRLVSERDALAQRLASAAAATDPLDVYLNVSLACLPFVVVTKPPDPADVAAPALASSTLVQWRLASCGRERDADLRAFAAAHPRYVEADYWLGHHLLALVGEPRQRREARERLRAADTAIPGSPAIAFELAGVTRVTSPKEALPLYERVVRAEPRHHEAWLGLGICLTHLDRSPDAIAAFTTVIELGRWFTGEAYYWRAWNRHHLGELDAAWADVTAARRSLFNTDVFGLAGRIAHDRREFEVARPLLEQALKISDANCPAAWYLGLVESALEQWLAGGRAFEGAERCYRADVDHIREELRRAETSRDDTDETDDAARAARVAAAEAGIRAAEQQAALAAYNAAFGFVKGGEAARARPFLDRAVTHPFVSDRARELRAFVDR